MRMAVALDSHMRTAVTLCCSAGLSHENGCSIGL